MLLKISSVAQKKKKMNKWFTEVCSAVGRSMAQIETCECR